MLLCLSAQAAAVRGAPLAAVLATPVDDFLAQRTELEIDLDGTLAAGERLVIELGSIDVTDLFRRRGRSLLYRADLMPLPAGETELVVSRQPADGAVAELLRQSIRVRTRRGLDQFEVRPTVDIEGSSQVDSGRSPEDGEGRESFTAATGQFRLETSAERARSRFDTEVTMVGVSEVENALRFAEKGEQADRLDLASFRLRLVRDRGYLELGHTTFGNQRHLVSNMASRGLLAGLPLGSHSVLQLYAASGSQIVGFDDLSGLGRSEHRILAGALLLSARPEEPEALALELGYLSGSLLPIPDFNQAVVDDAEESRGLSVRVEGKLAQRGRFDVGYSNSVFRNPQDPLLSQGEALVEAEEEDRGAWFADVDFALLRTSPEEGWANDLTLAIDYERIEPLYRSTAAFVQADLEQSRVTLNGTSGPIAYGVGHYSSQDNLDDVASILKTRTRGSTLNLALPLRQVGGGAQRSVLWPILTLLSERTHQFGVAVPDNGEFSDSHVPDQVSLRHLAGAEWQGSRWRLAYELSFSHQDNRQPGRESDDFEQRNHALRLSLSPLPTLDIGLELARESAEAMAAAEIVRTERPGASFLWRASDRLQWSGSQSRTETDGADSRAVSRVSTLEGGYRLSFGREGGHGIGGQLFARYTDEDVQQDDTLFDFSFDRREWAVQVGLNLSFH